MKKWLMVLVSGLVLLAGCATTPETAINRAAIAAKLAAYVGTAEYLREHPDKRGEFERARDQLKLLASAEQVDMVTLVAIAQQLPIEELKSREARLIVLGAMTLLVADAQGPVPLGENLKPIAAAMREGIDLALLAQAE